MYFMCVEIITNIHAFVHTIVRCNRAGSMSLLCTRRPWIHAPVAIFSTGCRTPSHSIKSCILINLSGSNINGIILWAERKKYELVGWWMSLSIWSKLIVLLRTGNGWRNLGTKLMFDYPKMRRCLAVCWRALAVHMAIVSILGCWCIHSF